MMTTTYKTLDEVRISDALRVIAGPVFAAVCSDRVQIKEITVHAAAECEQRALKAKILSALGADAKVRVRFHNAASLLAAKSLEAFVSKLGGNRIVYDPTGALLRAKGLVEASRAVRAALGGRVSGLYYAPRLRTFYVTLEKARVALGDKVKFSDLASIEHSVGGAIRVAFAGANAECPMVRVGFGLPGRSLVPVDNLSVVGLGTRFVQSLRRYWKPITVAAMFGFGATGVAQSQEAAVSEPNFKLRGSVGEVIDDYTWQVEGAFTAPLGERFGLALEGGGGANNGNEFYGAGAHLFARDPDSYLVGLFAAYSEGYDFDIDATRAGAEFEFYLNELTVSGTAGYQFSDSLGDKGFASLDLKWYVSNNFAISAGAFGDEDATFGRARLEWQPGFAALPGLAFHADGVWGEDDYQSVMGGLTYYFGSPVSLMDRHRKQDPDSALFSLFQSVQEEQARLCAIYGGC